jgi:hypothetical protein
MYRYASQGLGAPTTVSWSFDGGLLTSDTMGSPGEVFRDRSVVFFFYRIGLWKRYGVLKKG